MVDLKAQLAQANATPPMLVDSPDGIVLDNQLQPTPIPKLIEAEFVQLEDAKKAEAQRGIWPPDQQQKQEEVSKPKKKDWLGEWIEANQSEEQESAEWQSMRDRLRDEPDIVQKLALTPVESITKLREEIRGVLQVMRWNMAPVKKADQKVVGQKLAEMRQKGY